MLTRTISKLTTKLALFVGTSLALVAGGVVTFVSQSAIIPTTPSAQARVKLQTIHKSIRLSDAVSLGAPALEQSSASPLTLAMADFDEDGTPDLLSGSVNAGVGFLSFYRGNNEAIYPTQRGANSSSPFSPANIFTNLPAVPDFLVAGDFNADGHSDLVTAARNGSSLYLLVGDGKGAFAEATTLELSAAVTSLAAGEINRVDGLADLAVAVTDQSGARLMLFAGAEGAWRAVPKSFALKQAASALEFAHLTRDGLSDLAIAAGNELVVLEGGQQVPRLTRTALSFTVDSLAVGRFTRTTHDEIALLARDGSLSVASYQSAAEQRGRQSNRARSNSNWQVTSYLSDATARLENTGARQLLRARVSASKHDDLLTLQHNQLQFVTHNDTPQIAVATLEGNAELIAALPLRSNASALQGVVLVSRNHTAPLLVQAVPEASFTVNSTADAPDLNPGDGTCAASAGAPICTLRAAIQEANASAGADTITFNIGAGTQGINLNSVLPPITETLTIDAFPLAPAPASQIIALNATGQITGGIALLTVVSGNTAIRGLVINNLSGFAGIRLQSGGNNRIEGNDILNGFDGVQIEQSAQNIIGGTTVAASNIMSGNFDAGVVISGALSTGNQILGNYIGTEDTGVRSVANGVGISIDLAVNNIIGGTTTTARNLISGNFEEGIEVIGNQRIPSLAEAADGNVIQGNYIGVDATGTAALGNGVLSEGGYPGITLSGASNTTIGGTVAGAGNVIANNGDDGVSIPPRGTFPGSEASLNNAILGNSIFNNSSLGIDLEASGVTTNDPGDGDAGSNNVQNYPILTAALTRPTGTTITGTLNSTASSTFTIEFFSNAACDSSGNGEGETFIARTTVSTNAAGVANFSFVAPTSIAAGRLVTATATDANNNTSEFSTCVAVQSAAADLDVTQTISPNPILVGNNLTYNVTVTNSGPDDATGVLLTNAISIPNGQFTLVSVTPSQGTCTGTGPITCSLGTIVSTANATVRIVVAPTIPTTGTPPQSVTATNIANVISSELDRVIANNTSVAGATVNASADLAVSQTVSPNPAASGSVVTYTITLTNNGPSTASGPFARFDPSLLLTNVTCTAPAGWSCNRDGNPFFASAANFAPGTAVFTVQGTLSCLGQNATLTSSATVSSSTTDVNAANNASTLNSAAQAGAAIGTIAYDVANTTSLQLGPVVAGSSGTPPSGTFTLTNTGCLPMNLTTAQFVRAGNTTNLSGVDDSRYFSLRLVPATGAEISLPPTANPDRNAPQPIPVSRTLQSGQSLRFRVVFNPSLPFFAGVFAVRDQGLFANQVLPDLFSSRIVFNFITGNSTPLPEAAGDPGTAAADLTARVAPAIQIIPRDGNTIGNPATTPLVIMETLRGDFRVRVSMYDANKNATRITYQFFDTFRQPASNPIAVDLTSLISSSALLPGQAFTIQQDFSGAAGRPDIVYVRVSVTDGDGTTVAASSSSLLPALAPSTLGSTEAFNSDVITLPALRINGSAGLGQTDFRQDTKARREN